jgi:hypothetical protein
MRISTEGAAQLFGLLPENAEGSGIPVASWIVKVLNSLPARRFGQLSTSQSTLSMPIGLGWFSQGFRGDPVLPAVSDWLTSAFRHPHGTVAGGNALNYIGIQILRSIVIAKFSRQG